MGSMLLQARVDIQNRLRGANGPQHPSAEIEFVRAQRENRIVELAGDLERPPARAGGENSLNVQRLWVKRCSDFKLGQAAPSVETNRNVVVLKAVGRAPAMKRCETYALCIGR